MGRFNPHISLFCWFLDLNRLKFKPFSVILLIAMTKVMIFVRKGMYIF